MTTFITADEHHGHANIIRFCKRPFASVEEQTETIIAKHNAKVTNENDLTIHTGDMFWKTLTVKQCHEILDRMNGKHAYVWGNHEEVFERGNDDLHKRFVWMKDLHELYIPGHKKWLTVCHYALRVWNGSHYGTWHVYGHSHNELPEVGLSFDAGVDGHDFEPWSTDEIAEKMYTKKNHHIIPADKVWPGKDPIVPVDMVRFTEGLRRPSNE